MGIIYRVLSLIFLSCLLTACDPPTATDVKGTNPPTIDFHLPSLSYNETIWRAMRDHFRLNHETNKPAVKRQIAWFEHHPTYLYRVLNRSTPYIYYIYQQTRRDHLPAELALVPVIESAYSPFAYSRAGALGLWQLMPGTATGFGLKIDWWYDGRRDVIASTTVALNYLTYLHAFFDNNWLYAIAAYDSGAGTVKYAVRHNKRHDEKTSFWKLPLPRETEHYVPKLLAVAAIVENPWKYHIKLPPIEDRPYFTSVNVGSQIDLTKAAHLAGISDELMRRLNPGFRRWATDPGGPYNLLIPTDDAAKFKKALVALPKQDRVTWRHYTVRPGDTVDKIARKFSTSVAAIERANHLHDNIIRVHHSLLIPNVRHVSYVNHYTRSQREIAENYIPGPQQQVYVVRADDNLWKIARKLGVKVSSIRFWNNLKHDTTLYKGQKLVVWRKHHYRHYAHHYRRRSNSHFSHIEYKVRLGDSLDSIAHRYHTTAKKLKHWNHLANNKYIHPGQELIVYLYQ